MCCTIMLAEFQGRLNFHVGTRHWTHSRTAPLNQSTWNFLWLIPFGENKCWTKFGEDCISGAAPRIGEIWRFTFSRFVAPPTAFMIWLPDFKNCVKRDAFDQERAFRRPKFSRLYLGVEIRPKPLFWLRILNSSQTVNRNNFNQEWYGIKVSKNRKWNGDVESVLERPLVTIYSFPLWLYYKS